MNIFKISELEKPQIPVEIEKKKNLKYTHTTPGFGFSDGSLALVQLGADALSLGFGPGGDILPAEEMLTAELGEYFSLLVRRRFFKPGAR